MASVLLLVLGLAALAGLANARHPSRAMWLAVPSWAAAMVTVELAPHLIVLGSALGALLVLLGGLGHWTGWAGLGAVALAEAIAVPLILRARRTEADLGPVVDDLERSEPASPYPRLHIAFPLMSRRRRGVRVTRGVRFADPPRRVKLDIYRPAAPADGPRPAIIEVHGGGWIAGSRREQGIPLCTHLAANGWVAFNTDYRLSPRGTFPDQIVDIKRAIAWVRDHAEEHDVDPSFIAITGGSAGGHLSALAALTADDPSLQPGFEDADTSVAACIPFYGVYDFLDPDSIQLPIVHRVLERMVFKARRAQNPERFRAASPLYRVHPGAPPFFVIHGEDDSLVPVEDARRFVSRLRQVSHAPVLYAELRGAQHAFDLFPSWRTIPVLDAIERFLATVRATAREAVSAR